MKLSSTISLLFLAGSALATCDEDFPKYQACIAKAEQFEKFTTAEQVEKFCNSFDAEECKGFLSIVNQTSECIKDQEKLPVIAGYQLPYLAYCSKKSDNTKCPLTTFIHEHYSDFDKLNASSINEEVKNVIASDCGDADCNKRMVVIGENFQEPTIVMGAPKVFGDTFELFKLLTESYKNNVCDISAAAAAMNQQTATAPTTGDNKEGDKQENKDDKKENDESGASHLKITTFTFISLLLISIAMMI